MVCYCSLECRSADEFHVPGGPECGVPWPQLLPPDVVLAVRLAVRLACGSGMAAAALVDSLETHFSRLTPQAAVHCTLMAIVAEAARRRQWQCGAAPQGGGVQVTAGRVLRALCQVHVNGLAIVPAQYSAAEDRIGVAIYAVASMMNHACKPNLTIRFEVRRGRAWDVLMGMRPGAWPAAPHRATAYKAPRRRAAHALARAGDCPGGAFCGAPSAGGAVAPLLRPPSWGADDAAAARGAGAAIPLYMQLCGVHPPLGSGARHGRAAVHHGGL